MAIHVLWLMTLVLMIVTSTASRELDEDQLELHQLLEKALLSEPLNLFRLRETFFPRNVLMVPAAVKVDYNLTHGSASNDGDEFCEETTCTATEHTYSVDTIPYLKSFLWTPLPIDFARTDSITFAILTSFTKEHFGSAIPSVTLVLQVNRLPIGVRTEDVDKELCSIASMLKAYARTQAAPRPGNEDEAFAQEYQNERVQRIVKFVDLPLSLDVMCNTVGVWVLNTMIILIYNAAGCKVYKVVCEGRKGSFIYCLYWSFVLASFLLDVVVFVYYNTNLWTNPATMLSCAFEVFIAVRTTSHLVANEVHMPLSWIGTCHNDMVARILHTTFLWFILVASHIIAFYTLQKVVIFYTPASLETLVEVVFFSVVILEFFSVFCVFFYVDALVSSRLQKGKVHWNSLGDVLTALLPFIPLLFILIMIGVCTRAAALLYSQRQMQSDQGRLLFGFVAGVAVDKVLSWKFFTRAGDVFEERPQSEKVNMRKPPNNEFVGLDVLNEVSIVVTNEGRRFEWAGYGLKLHFPCDCLPPGEEECQVHLKVGLTGNFDLPENVHLVSAVYWLYTSVGFTKPPTLEMEHCAGPEAAEEATLRIIRAECPLEGEPCKFAIMEGTNAAFKSHSSYGSISLSQFSVFGIGDIFNSIQSCLDYGFEKLLSRTQYWSVVYNMRNPENRNDFRVIVVVIKKLEAYMTAIQKQYEDELGAISGSSGWPFKFRKRTISLIPPDPDESGWELTVYRGELEKDQVDSYKGGTQFIPVFELRMTWTRGGQEVVRVTYKVKLDGTSRDSDYVIIESDPISRGAGARQQLDITPVTSLRMRYVNGLESEPEMTDLMNQVGVRVSQKWRCFGLQLGLTMDQLNVIESQRTECRDRIVDVFDMWNRQRTLSYKWSTVINALNADSVMEVNLATGLMEKLEQSSL